jgi:hypothetical protein
VLTVLAAASVAPAAVVEFVAVGVGMSFGALGAGAQVGAQLVALAGGIRFRDIVRSELIKFRSTRPGPLTVAASLVADADTGMLFGQVLGSNQGG